MNVNIVLAQLNFIVGDIEHNAAKILKACFDAKKKYAADIIVFPELALSGYPPEDLLFRKDFLEKIHSALLSIQNNLPESLIAIIGYPEQGVYNSAVIMTKEKILLNYRKQILPNYGVFDEKRYFKPGNDNGVFECRGIKIGVLICEDVWEPSPSQEALKCGAQIMIVLNASPFEANKLEARLQVLKTRAQDIQRRFIYLNHCGTQDDLIFDGSSFVVDASGEILLKAPFAQECLIVFNPEKDKLKPVNEMGKIGRHDKYGQIYQALVMSVRDYVTKNHFEKVVLGFSGGIDSALTLAIAVDALGKENVLPVFIPSRFTTPMSLSLAKQQCQNLQLNFQDISLEPMLDAFLSSLELNANKKGLKDKNAGLTLQNIQARIRGTLLMALTNRYDCLLLNTTNKSEIAVGYGTLYGDLSGAYAVLKDVWKTEVYQLARYRNQQTTVIPEGIITREPSAELAYGQRDSDHLPPYEILDEILKRYIEQQMSIEQIVQLGFPRDIVKKVVRLVVINEFKRKQAPLGPRVSALAFTRERRYPITSGYY